MILMKNSSTPQIPPLPIAAFTPYQSTEREYMIPLAVVPEFMHDLTRCMEREPERFRSRTTQLRPEFWVYGNDGALDPRAITLDDIADGIHIKMTNITGPGMNDHELKNIGELLLNADASCVVLHVQSHQALAIDPAVLYAVGEKYRR
jgi:hypothetical protein